MSESTKWKPGQSGNPTGGKSLKKKEYEAKWSEVNPKDHLGRTFGQMIVDKEFHVALYSRGIAASRAMNNICDRVFGKPAQAVDVNMTVMTREQYVAQIEEALAVLPAEADGPSDTRIM